MSSVKTQSTNTKKDIWNYRGSVIFSPVYNWPPEPLAIFLSFTKRWVTVTRNFLFLLIAVCVYNFFLPDLETMKSLSWDWVLPILARNALLLTALAGGFHLYFFTYKKQGKKLKFDPREKMDKTKHFKFNNQLHDNIFWSFVSGIPIWTAYEVLYYWGAANQVIPVLEFSSSPIAFFVWLLVLPTVLAIHFYYTHRMLHWPFFYKPVHLLHHRNIHIGPWSGMSMHPIEHILYISSVLIHFIIPTHPIIVLIHLYIRCLAPAFSHAGFETLLIKDKEVTATADFHHQLHHRFFECNYGNVEVPLDRWHNTLHDGSDEATALLQEKRLARAMQQKQKTKK